MKKQKNWKTTVFGITTILSGIGLIIKGSMVEGVTAIVTGFGLVTAKDYDHE